MQKEQKYVGLMFAIWHYELTSQRCILPVLMLRSLVTVYRNQKESKPMSCTIQLKKVLYITTL